MREKKMRDWGLGAGAPNPESVALSRHDKCGSRDARFSRSSPQSPAPLLQLIAPILNDRDRMSKDGLPLVSPAFRLRELPNSK